MYSNLFKKYFDKNHLIGLGITTRKTKDNQYEYYNSLSIFDNNLDLIKNYNKLNLYHLENFFPLKNFLIKLDLRQLLITSDLFPKEKIEKL